MLNVLIKLLDIMDYFKNTFWQLNPSTNNYLIKLYKITIYIR